MNNISQHDLNAILESHRVWLLTRGKYGKSAIFEDVHLTHIDFREKNLQYIYFTNSVLEECDFSKADLTHAALMNNDFKKSNFTESNLNKADFNYSKLSGTVFTNSILLNTNFDHTIFSPINLKIYDAYHKKRPIFFHKSIHYPEGDYLRIGSKGLSIKEWLIYFEHVSIEEDYTMTEKRFYKELILELIKENKK